MMKRGKDEEKSMGPMFPRLHVNDTEKGGPRAPPRNKMALYEQLSIPSQRFTNGILPLKPNNNSNLVPVASSSQGSGYGRGMLLPVQLPYSRPAEKQHTSYSDLNTPSMQLEQKKKLEEGDFRVPIFVQSEMNEDHGNYNGNDNELSTLGPAYMGHSTKNQRSCDEEPNQINNVGLNRRQDGRHQSEENSRKIVSGRTYLVKSTSSQSSKEKPKGLLKQTNAVSRYEHNGHLANNNGRLSEPDGESYQGHRVESRLGNSTCDVLESAESNKGINNRTSSLPMGDSQSQEQMIPNNHVMDIYSYEDMVCRSAQTGNVDRGDDVSETSMVDSISALDISPDDVVEIIGQKRFWKVRRAIINQQRVFAVQVFELHRLMKVQRLIAGSPHLLIEDNAYLGKPITGSTVKKLPLEYVLKAPSKISKHKEPDKPNHKMEGSAENAIGKPSLPLSQNGTQSSNNRQSFGNHQPTSFPMDPKLSPWCFHQQPGHQWLIPVMSPSEGLVYKPYPGSAFTNTVCGSPGSTPIMGNMLDPAYDHHPSHQHYQGMGVPPFAPSAGHNSYFPPYGMPVMYPPISGAAIEQMNDFTGPGLHRHSSGGSANFNLQHQNTSNVSSQKNRAVSNSYKLHASKDGELQISTASSPSDRVPGIRMTNASKVRNALPLFPTCPAFNGSDFAPKQHEVNQPTPVIKVVPHNARSATESAARIFKSIQEERKEHNSI